MRRFLISWWDAESIRSSSDASIASMKYGDGAPVIRLLPSASHHVSGANWTMCSLPFGSMT
jgi:hypothetical protein